MLFYIIFRFLIIALPNLSICGHIALSIQNAAKTFITYLDFQLQIMRKRSHLKVIQAVKYSFVTLLISNSLDEFPTCHTQYLNKQQNIHLIKTKYRILCKIFSLSNNGTGQISQGPCSPIF